MRFSKNLRKNLGKILRKSYEVSKIGPQMMAAFGLNVVAVAVLRDGVGIDIVAVLRDRLLWDWALCLNYNIEDYYYYYTKISTVWIELPDVSRAILSLSLETLKRASNSNGFNLVVNHCAQMYLSRLWYIFITDSFTTFTRRKCLIDKFCDCYYVCICLWSS